MKKTVTLLLFITMLLSLKAQQPVSTERVQITRETFGLYQFDTGTNPYVRVVAPGDTVRANAPADYPGYSPHWDWDAVRDSGGFTSTNGQMMSTSSDSSIRIPGYPELYSGALEESGWDAPSGANAVMLVHRPGAYFGSWDSIAFTGINVSGYESLELQFGHVYRPGFKQNDFLGLVIEARIDSGEWVMLDTASIDGASLTDAAWSLVSVDIPDEFAGGQWLDIQIGAVNIDNKQHLIDDVTIIGSPVYDSVQVTRETFGIYQFDTGTNPYVRVVAPGDTIRANAPADFPGYSPHWDWDAVRDSGGFTSTNGQMMSTSSDSSIRIPGYPELYSGSLEQTGWDAPSGANAVMLVHRPGAYFGSWDSIAFTGINIAGHKNLALSFAHLYRPGFKQNDFIGLIIEARVDSGEWEMLDTASLAGPQLTDAAWSYVTLTLPVEMEGEWLDIQIGAVNVDNKQHLIDDVTISGWTTGQNLVQSITISGAGGASEITNAGGTLQMNALVEPEFASDKTYEWSLINGTGIGNIDENGLLTAECNGTVTVVARANDAAHVIGSKEITLSNQSYLPTSVRITSRPVDIVYNQLQMTVDVLPACANDLSVNWSIETGADIATIDDNGLLTVNGAGSVKVRATSVAADDVFNEVSFEVGQSGLDPKGISNITLNPNPVVNMLYIKNTGNVTEVEIIGLGGNIIKKYTNNGNITITMDASDMNSGIYFVKVRDAEGRSYVKKFVKE